jgi:tetratricopeptide (TPR) repeat protein
VDKAFQVDRAPVADDVTKLLDEAARLPYGEPRTVLVERALREAQAGREPERVIAARLALTRAYQYGGEPVKSFATFSRSLADHDDQPGRFTEWQRRGLLWQYKWIMNGMRKFPQVPLPQALDALDDMERRYREAGNLVHAVYAQRCFTAWHLGDEQGAVDWMRRWRITPRDELSDCRACDVGSQASMLVARGLDEEAAEVAAPVLAGESGCHVQPQGILCTLLLPYVRLGRPDAAAEAHRRAYRIVQGKAAYLDDFGDHLEFCALTGHDARGLEILQRELPLLDRAPSPGQARTFMAGAALVLRRLLETGQGHLTVRRAGRDVPVPELRAEMEAGAREIAARFDARNGGDVHTRRLEASLSARPLVDDLPLFPHTRRATTAAPEHDWHRGRTALGPVAEPGAVSRSERDRPADATPEGSTGSAPAVVPDGSPESPAGSTSAAVLDGSPEASAGAVVGAVRDLAEAVAGFTALGDDARAGLARVDLCRAYLAAGRPLDAAETAEEALALLDPADAASRDAVRRTHADALLELGELQAALTALRELGDPAATVEAAELLARCDDDREAADAYGEAADQYREAGDLPAAGRAMRLRAKCVYYATGDDDAIRAAYEEAGAALAAASDVSDESDQTAGVARSGGGLDVWGGVPGGGVAWEVAELAYDEAVALSWMDDGEAAAARCHEALAAFTALGDQEGVARARDVLEELD